MKYQALLVGMITTATQLAQAAVVTCSLTPSSTSAAPSAVTSVDPSTAFDVEDFSFAVSDAAGAGSQNSGSGAGTVGSNSIRITKQLDGLSGMLFAMAAEGASFQTVACTISGAQLPLGGASGVGLTATMSNATITGYRVAKASDGKPHETLSLNFTKIQVSYTTQK